ncbi:4'-phosphopantetheinyl transferase [Actinidia chinensis var. chinensis]|uniref:holo-[acyl-carrier-protein] synthase n=1 Tax=Actinidia chinensis var. chinensis TaxID=1590841 RepID=A0A2R6PXP2_ACTCC|nr:4'-phosphopantetheinyl transferase [Actinidia chinensis var. chinensis]
MLSYLCRATSSMKTHCFNQKFFHSSFPLAPVQLPSHQETHFWYILPNEVKNASLLNQYLELLSPHEKENVFRMRGEELKKGALLARALVRTTIARYQVNPQVSVTSLKFRKNIHGKPEVEWPHNDDGHQPLLHFNLSHTSSLIACGVTMNSPIGIDVEEKQRTIKNNILSFARRYFTHHEVELLAAISDPEVQRQEFIKLWTLKEAYVKALGRGFSGAPFKTFTLRYKAAAKGSFHLSGNSNSEASEITVDSFENASDFTSKWQFAIFELAGSHYAAICRGIPAEAEGSVPMKLTVWKTIPFVEDKRVSGTDAVVRIGGLFD